MEVTNANNQINHIYTVINNNNYNNNFHPPSNSHTSSTKIVSPSSHPQEDEELKEGEKGIRKMMMDSNGDCGGEPHSNPTLISDGLQNFTTEEIAKYKKYEADYASRLRAKYFSSKDVYGGEIFDLTVMLGNENIRASRWSPTRSYADPEQSFERFSREMPSDTESLPSVSNGNLTPQTTS